MKILNLGRKRGNSVAPDRLGLRTRKRHPYQEIVRFGVLTTPAPAIYGKVKLVCKVVSAAEILPLLP